ncbi:MAG: hypothetical protein U0166_01595 [Acidobacteriota bacterium]
MNKRLHARLFMGTQLLRHLLSRLQPGVRRRRGLARFEASFFSEGLLPISPGLRGLLPRVDRCLACDLCVVAPIPPHLASPRELALRVLRSPAEWPLVRDRLAARDAYQDAESLCPERIPFGELSDEVRSGGAVPASAPRDGSPPGR